MGQTIIKRWYCAASDLSYLSKILGISASELPGCVSSHIPKKYQHREEDCYICDRGCQISFCHNCVEFYTNL